ncbi:PP2C family protein-serine/threonine phosphatase [Acidicapsa ligni]|uniref:PP2C family protein-serine/threonine phosphatase n=1 Tax=Acidicapsa ligni TaxID=542300 RepID=UPI0021DFF26E|nr:SpoIIE family protein phosphatase [Acidicapsa ligni]
MPEPSKLRWLLVWTIFCLALLSASSLPGQPLGPTFDFIHDREAVVSLDGSWRFHPGDNPAWADPALDDSSWPLLKGDKPWSSQGYPGMSGFGWYRFTVQIPAQSDSAKSYSLLFSRIFTSYELYVDGHLIGTSGEMPPSIAPHAMFQFQTFPLPAPPPGQTSAPQTLHIALRIWHSPIWASYIGGGPSGSGNLVGESSLIQTELQHRFTLGKVIFVDDYVFSIVGALVGFTTLGLFFFRIKDHEYLWFAILLLSLAADSAIQIAYNVYAFFPIPIFDLFDGALIAANMAAALAFFSIVLRTRRGRIWYITLALALISPLSVILYWPGWLPVAASAALQLICLLPSSIWILTILLRRAIQRDADALLLLFPTSLYIGYGFVYNLAILLSQAGWTTVPDILLNPLPLPPFTIHWMILFDLIFLAALLAFLIRRFSQARQGEERYAGQLEAARQVQQILLPEAIVQIPGFNIDCIYHPAEQVGGDFFQILTTSCGDLLVVIGDVAGKGLPAAMMVSVLVGAIRTEAAHTCDPSEILASLNERMVGRSHDGFTTCLCLHITIAGQVTLASAGHLSPYRDGEELPLAAALPLGIIAKVPYEPHTFSLIPGQRLTLVSDGVLEAQSRHGELFGFDRTQQISNLSASEIAQTAIQFGQVDDITVVTIDFQGSPSVSIPLLVAVV